MTKQPCVYIMGSKHYGTLYVSVTSNIVARLYLHRTGAVPGFTSRYGITRLLRYEFFADISSAVARENKLKAWWRDWNINLIASDNPHWDDLAVGLGLEPLAWRWRYDGC